MVNVFWSVMVRSIHRFLIKAERFKLFQIGSKWLSLRANCFNSIVIMENKC